MPSLSHADVIAMMEPVGTLWVERNVRGMEVNISVHVDRRDPAVYAWVVDGNIHYIGKAGKGLKHRMAEHARGMKGTDGGAEHAEHLANMTARGRTVWLYALWPDLVPFAGAMIPSYSSVEDYLLEAITPKPVRNR